MSYSIWGAIAETPWWLYLFFLGLLKIARQSTKPHNVRMTSSLIMPLVLNAMLIFALIILIPFDLHTLTLLSCALIPGIGLGWLQFRLRHIKAIKSQSQFYIPGSWSLFIILFVLIAAKMYYSGYGFNLTINTFTEANNRPILVSLSGLVMGLSIGRACFLYRCMKYGPFLEEK